MNPARIKGLLGPFCFLLLALSVPILNSDGESITGYNPPLVIAAIGALLAFNHLLSPRDMDGFLSSLPGNAYILFGIISLALCFMSPVDAAEALLFQLKLIIMAGVVLGAASICRSIRQIKLVMWAYLILWMAIYAIGLILYLNPGESVQLFGHDLKPRINYWHYDRYRLISVVGNTYIIGFSFTLFMPFCLYLHATSRSASVRFALILSLAISLLVCALTFSKTAILTLASLLLLHFVLFGRIRLRFSYGGAARAGVTAFLVLGLISAILWVAIGHLEAKYDVSILKSVTAIVPSLSDPGGRADTWSWIFSIAEKWGWGFSGLGSGQIFSVMTAELGFATGCDSGFLAALLEKGPLGLIGMVLVYLAAIGDSFAKAIAAGPDDSPDLRRFYRTKTSVIAGCFLFEFTMQNFDTIGFQFMMILFIYGLRPRETGESGTPPILPRPVAAHGWPAGGRVEPA
jgi:hypothetical protein